MNRITHFFNHSVFLFSLLLLSGCTGQNAEDKRINEEKAQIRKDIVKLVSDLPHPTVVPNAIKSIGAEFNHDLISELHGIESYMDDEDKAALNLGVFSADIGYLIAYDEVNESIDTKVD